jgi:predicted nucleotidyltransferase component of viral defense system
MIPRRFVTEWRRQADWQTDAQVEQDLIICRMICEIFSDDILGPKLAFRGGTALHKLYLKPQKRYSEDIDLVQIEPQPISEVFDRIRAKFDFLGIPRTKQSGINNTVVFRYESEIEPKIGMKLKLEINTREHFTVLGFKEFEYEVKSGWYSGSCTVRTYELEEIAGTKLRALYQRSKGRDLYDIYRILNEKKPDVLKLLRCYREYMKHDSAKIPTKEEFEKNLLLKINNKDFIHDLTALLRVDDEYEVTSAFKLVEHELISRM